MIRLSKVAPTFKYCWNCDNKMIFQELKYESKCFSCKECKSYLFFSTNFIPRFGVSSYMYIYNHNPAEYLVTFTSDDFHLHLCYDIVNTTTLYVDYLFKSDYVYYDTINIKDLKQYDLKSHFKKFKQNLIFM